MGEIETVKEFWPSIRDGALWVYNASSLNAVAMIAGAGLIWHSLRTPKATEKPSPSPVPVPRSEEPTQRPETEKKIVIDVTPEYLMDLFSVGKTSAQSDREAAPYIGKWVKWSYAINNIRVLSSGLTMVSFGFVTATSARLVFLHFDVAWAAHLEALNIGDRITVFGRIDAIDRSEVQLWSCELVN